MARRTAPPRADAPDPIDPSTQPLPLRRARERYREPEGPQHRPTGSGAHVYGRVSSDEQARPGRTSIDEQVRLCQKALAGADIPIVGIWCDEGFSGVTRLGERPVGRELLAAVKSGEIIAVYRLDRLSRNATMGLADLNDLRQAGIGVFVVGDRRFIPPAGGEFDPIDQFNLQQGIVLAQFERDLLVARTQGGKRALIQRGYWPFGAAPYGWRREHDGIGFKLVSDGPEQQVLALMLRCHKRRASAPQITKALNEAGFRNRRGKPFEYSDVYSTMRKQEMIQPGVRSAKPSKAKLHGNPAIAAAQPAGISAVTRQKLHDAERAAPIIAELITDRGCGSYQRLADSLNYLEVKTPRGGHWHASSVRNTMAAANVSFAGLCTAAKARDLKPVGQPLPRRPDRTERQTVRRLYRLPADPRGRVQKAIADILFMRDRGMAAGQIARVLCLGLAGVRRVIKQYPQLEIDDRLVIEKILARHAGGEDARKIAHALGLELRQVRRVIGQRRIKRPRKRVRPLAQDRKAAILESRRQGKTGQEIFAELGVDTEPERVQIRRFLRRQARREPALALLNPPALTDEIAAAKSEAKTPAEYVRDDYYLQEYWDKRWQSPLPPEVVQAVELLRQGQPIVEVASRTGLPRERVKYLRAALQSGRCGLDTGRGSGS